MSNEPLLQVEPERGGDDPRQFEINNRHRDLDLADFDRTYVSFSGFFGEHSPHLFAAAPEMKEALEAVLKVVRDARDNQNCDASTELGGYIFGDVMSDAIDDAEAALAKAEGRA